MNGLTPGLGAMNAAFRDGLRDHHLESRLGLVREHWASVRRLWIADPGACAARIRSELPTDFVLGCGMPGLARIKPARDRRFEFAEDGLTAVIVPAYDTIPGLVGARAKRHVEELVDLVAVDLDQPDRYWRRRGEALVLGNAYLEVAGETCAPVPVFRNPMSWLRAAGGGVCILDWTWARDLLLDHELIAENLDLGAALDDALKPDIWIREAAA